MPATIGSGVIQVDSGTSTSTAALNIPNTGTNRCLVVVSFAFHNFSPPNTVTGVTFGGVAMTAGPADTTVDIGQLKYWYLVNPTVGTSQNIVVTCAGNVNQIAVMAQGFSGVDQTTPFGTGVASPGTNAASSTGTVTLAGSDIALAALWSYDAAGAYTVTPNGTGIVEQENNQFDTTFGFQYRATATIGWSFSTTVDDFAQFAVPLKDVAASTVDPGVIYGSATVLSPFISLG